MIELPPSHLRLALAIRAGATTVDKMSEASAMGRVRLMNVLRFLGDTLGVARASGRGGKLCDVDGVVVAVRAAPGFVLRDDPRGPYQPRGADDETMFVEPHGISWPDYGEHNLRFPA